MLTQEQIQNKIDTSRERIETRVSGLRSQLDELSKTPNAFESKFKAAGLNKKIYAVMAKNYLLFLARCTMIVLVTSMVAVPMVALVWLVGEALEKASPETIYLVKWCSLLSATVFIVVSVAYWIYAILFIYKPIGKRAEFWYDETNKEVIEQENMHFSDMELPYYWKQDEHNTTVLYDINTQSVITLCINGLK